MQTEDSQKIITELEFQIDYQEKRLDLSLKNDFKLGESRKLLHELRLLKDRLNKLRDRNSDN